VAEVTELLLWSTGDNQLMSSMYSQENSLPGRSFHRSAGWRPEKLGYQQSTVCWWHY